MAQKWTPGQREALRAEGRPFRLALARQTSEQKAEQRVQMRASLNAEQLEALLHLWKALAIEVREISTQMQAVHKDLTVQIRQLQDQHQHEDTDDHGEPLPARSRV